MIDAALFQNTEIHDFILRALAEDIGDGDHSSLASIPEGTQGKAQMIIKDEGILAGLELARVVFHIADPSLNVTMYLHDGMEVKKGDIGLLVEGSVHAILRTERLVLNLTQRLSGIATRTFEMNKLIEGTGCILLDTRKTTPGLRLLEKWAVKMGGGANHRMGLYDMIMLKDNHNDYAGGITKAVKNTVAYLAEKERSLKIEVETRNIEEVKEALATGKVDRIMLDNFSVEGMKEAVEWIDGRVETEASGGITEETIRAYAETGVNYISVGALTHSVRSMDISLKEV